jgi:hypothetical protein
MKKHGKNTMIGSQSREDTGTIKTKEEIHTIAVEIAAPIMHMMHEEDFSRYVLAIESRLEKEFNSE